MQSSMVDASGFHNTRHMVLLIIAFNFFIKGHARPLFLFIFSLSNKQYKFYKKLIWKMSIQYLLLIYELNFLIMSFHL